MTSDVLNVDGTRFRVIRCWTKRPWWDGSVKTIELPKTPGRDLLPLTSAMRKARKNPTVDFFGAVLVISDRRYQVAPA